jgi:SAM-dependent methyltransferase
LAAVKGGLKALLPVPVLRTLRSARLATWSVVDRVRGGGVAPGYGGLIGEGDFDAVGLEFLGYFRDLAQLDPTERVLDIGCGLGRMAAPLTTYLTTGSYCGFDVVKPGIESCRRRFASYPQFEFDHVDVYNGKYNPKGRIRPSEFRFPYGDAEFDFAFASSVFTHMLSTDVERYLRETARVLRPGGRSLATWFLMTPENAALVERGQSEIAFEPHGGDVWLADAREPETAVAHELEAVRELYARAGLEIDEPIRPGTWSGGEGLSYQDLVIAHRAEA